MHVEIGQQLRENRKKLKLNQQAIADQLNIDRSTYTCYEIGKTYPPIDTLIRLAHIFNTTVDELLGNRPERPLVVSESTPPYEAAPPISLTQSERSILLKLRELDGDSLKKVNDLIDRCLSNLD